MNKSFYLQIVEEFLSHEVNYVISIKVDQQKSQSKSESSNQCVPSPTTLSILQSVPSPTNFNVPSPKSSLYSPLPNSPLASNDSPLNTHSPKEDNKKRVVSIASTANFLKL